MAALVHIILVLTALMPAGVQSTWTWHCDTSSNSPTKDDVNTAIWKLPGNCCQSNDVGSKCTTLSNWGSANIDYCNTSGYQCDNCINVRNSFSQLVSSCTANIDGVDRVGGWLDWDDDVNGIMGDIELVRS